MFGIFFIQNILYIYRMKSFIGLVLLACFFMLTQSFGFAIPNDTKIEKVSKAEVKAVDLIACMDVIVISKIADSRSLKPDSLDLCLFINPEHFADISGISKNEQLNYNLLKKHDSRYNLPLKVGWRK